MIIWVNGAFGAGKTTICYELQRRIPDSYVYDPENIGFFIRKNTPKQVLKADFQDHIMWREMNYSMLKAIYDEYAGVIIVPMTIVNPQYFAEIIGRLKADGVEIKHFALLATRETLLKRLKSRGENQHSWAAQQIDRCLASLSQDMFKFHLYTDNLTPEEIIDQIAAECKLQLQPDHRGTLKKKLDRLTTKIKHIRI